MTRDQTAAAEARLAWFQEAKFGLFIHWGPYSVAGVEASWPMMAPDASAILYPTSPPIGEAEYRSLPQRFNPVEFDPDAWVRLARQAGMRYLIFTSKHHDGFCMFDAPGTDYKITRTPYGRDICAELAGACARGGLHLGFYYSPPDMHHPGYRDTRRPVARNWLGEPRRPEWLTYLDYMAEHMRALLTGYGPVCTLWFDGLASHEKYNPPRFHRLIAECSPSTLVNDRLGRPYDFITPEQAIPRGGIPVKGVSPSAALTDRQARALLFLIRVPGVKALIRALGRRGAQDGLPPRMPVSPEPGPDQFQPWETCMTMNGSWGYNPSDTAFKPASALIRNLAEVASRGGNYLLNVGPTPRGTFPPQAQERLEQVGRWLAANGEAIYGTTYGPIQDLPWARTTAKRDVVYLHVLDWPAGGQLILPRFPCLVSAVSLLAGRQPLPFTRLKDGLCIQGPPEPPDAAVSVVAMETQLASRGERH